MGRAFQLVGKANGKALSKGEPACSQTSEARGAGAQWLGEGPREAGPDWGRPCDAFDFDSE